MVNRFNILLINPSCLDKRITDDDARVVPIGLYYIAALLMDHDFKVTILNLADSTDDPLQSLIQTIDVHSYDLVGFSVTNPSRINAMACAVLFKKKHPDVPVVFGGPAPTFMFQHFFDTCPAIDYIIPSEGEHSFLELAQAIRNNTTKKNSTRKDTIDRFKDINGLIYKDKDKLIQTPLRAPIKDLDTLPHPSAYFSFTHLSMSRGCPGKCTFCGSPKFWSDQNIRFHSPEWMFEEIRALVKKNIHHFYISDDTFTMDKVRVLSLCQKIIEHQLPITWNAISRVDYVDEDLLFTMRQAGCIQISFGVESGSPEIRKTLGKPIHSDTIIQAFQLTLSHGILPRAYFIYGSPGETDQTIQDSVNLLHRLTPLSAVFYMLVLFPGTHLYTLAKNKGLIDDTVWQDSIEDLPWFELDEYLNFEMIKKFGDQLRTQFYSNVTQFASNIKLKDDTSLYPFHADFLSRLAMTFSHGEYATHPGVKNAEDTAIQLYEQALNFAPDARAFLGLGMLYQKKRAFDPAIAILKKGLRYYNDNVDLNICMGVCLMNLKQFKAALPFFQPFQSSEGIDHYINICQQHI